MKSLLFCCLITLFIPPFKSSAQNLVPNPSFEEYKKLRCQSIGDLLLSKGKVDTQASFDSILYNWTLPTADISNVYSLLLDSTCENSPKYHPWYGPKPKDGFNMVEIFIVISNALKNNREGFRSYVQTSLTTTLKPKQTYYCGMYVALADQLYATNNIGMLFTENAVGSNTLGMLRFDPQINDANVVTNTQWKLLSGCFTAKGNEQYLTLGNFYYDKDIKLVQHIFPSDGDPTSSYFIDSVFVQGVPELILPNVFTPNGDQYNEIFSVEGLEEGQWNLAVYNRWGHEVYKSVNYKNDWAGNGLSAGVYFYSVENRYCPDIKYKGTVQLIR